MIKEWGHVDILVSNASIFRDGLLAKISDGNWDLVVDLNLKGSFICARAAVSGHMIEPNQGRR